MHAYMHAQFAALMTLPMTEPRRMPIVSCALIYDTAIRVSAMTADRTGKFALLTYSLTAYHCSTEARLAGVQFPPSFDSRLALRQSRSTRLEVSFDVDANWAGWPKRWPSLDQVIQMRALKTSLTALDCYFNNPEHLTCSLLPSGSPYIKSWHASWTRTHAVAVMHRRTSCETWRVPK